MPCKDESVSLRLLKVVQGAMFQRQLKQCQQPAAKLGSPLTRYIYGDDLIFWAACRLHFTHTSAAPGISQPLADKMAQLQLSLFKVIAGGAAEDVSVAQLLPSAERKPTTSPAIQLNASSSTLY